IKLERILSTIFKFYPFTRSVFVDAIQNWFIDKLWIQEKISKHLKIPYEKIYFSNHHLSHAASAFFASPFKESAILTVDGVGEWTTAAISHGKDNEIRILKEMHFPNSVGLLYSTFTAFLGFEVNEGEYKVMGMAPFGKPRYVDKIKKIMKIYDDGSIELDLSYFKFYRSTQHTFSEKFVELFGEPRNPKLPFFTLDTGWFEYFGEKPSNFEELAKINEHYADIASSIQAVTEEILIKMAKHAKKLTDSDYLCMAGGVALNSVANWKIYKECGFKEVFVQPAAGDSGGSMGAALYLYTQIKNSRKFIIEHAYWGKSYENSEVYNAVKKSGLKYQEIDDIDKLLYIVAEKIASGSVCGWYRGRFEWGPRALGNRSILADPTNPAMKNIVNAKIKFREPFRPFAPTTLDVDATKYFDINGAEHHYPFRFMLYVPKVIVNNLPAITHVDGTARPQIIHKEVNPVYYSLIEKFKEIKGVGCLLNTSFNLKGEPIVNTPENAISTFLKSEMDVLVLNNFIITKSQL
ncbi:MAG: hypothetical protein NZ870_04730, partial [bacterium]|nr:hypothetical protein [bacterium]